MKRIIRLPWFLAYLACLAAMEFVTSNDRMMLYSGLVTIALAAGAAVWFSEGTKPSFQKRSTDWIKACFGDETAVNIQQLNQRFFEEACELVQSAGMPMAQAHKLVDYVYGRPIGDPYQEVGGVTIILAGLCSALEIDQAQAQEDELESAILRIDQIRNKQRNKPVFT